MKGSDRRQKLLREIHLRNFRNHRELNLIFTSGINVIHGENGKGKTSILEAIYVALKGKSFRGGINDVVRDEEDKALVIVRTGDSGARVRGKTIARQITRGGGMRTKIDGKEESGASSEIDLQVYVFTQESISLIKGEPSARREWLDALIEEAHKSAGEKLRDYRRALFQRNETLKSIRTGRDIRESLSPWEEIMADRGQYIKEQRLGILRELEERANAMLRGEGETISMKYYGTFEDKSDFLRRMIASRDKDILKGSTSVGPHRDEVVFQLNGRNLRSKGSQGQQRKTAILLTLAASDMLEEIKEKFCLLMLDDVTSELDRKNIGWLVERVSRRAQVLITMNTNRLDDLKECAQKIHGI